MVQPRFNDPIEPMTLENMRENGAARGRRGSMYAINELRFLLSEANYLTSRATPRALPGSNFWRQFQCRPSSGRAGSRLAIGRHGLREARYRGRGDHNVLSILRPR
jgi:hypothetical protein